jgi:hypothetical protein
MAASVEISELVVVRNRSTHVRETDMSVRIMRTGDAGNRARRKQRPLGLRYFCFRYL